MSINGKIAWLNIAFIVCGFWALNVFGSFLFLGISGVFSESTDASGIALVGVMFVVIGILPAFVAWKSFKAARRLSQKRRSQFVQEEAFK